ncbi:MAG: histidine--tRNA ligase [Actinomycetota bacterium]|nr:histidine--tRNA ligase [Actinomycetota bacterium]
MASEFRAPPGTHDVLPPESARWERLVAGFARRAGLAGYQLVISPLFEDVAVFQRVGEETDVVRKEMYDFLDKGGRRLALRPEGTAPVVRAFVQHRPPTLPWKTWYAAPSFRYERPQAGRYRQHHQLGVEVLGTDDPELDVEVLALAWTVVTGDVGLHSVTLLLNSLGDGQCRPAYLAALRRFLEDRRDTLCDEHRDRVGANPLRVLDCKRPQCREATADAPLTVDHLCPACAEHLSTVRSGLSDLGVPFTIQPRLVRGLDYYTRTTFELQSGALDSAQDALGGGGRYDGLVEALGGPPTPGIGFGLGIERILLAAEQEGAFPAPDSVVEVWVVDTTGGRAATGLVAELRAAGVRADRSFGGRSMKAQLKGADRSGARLALIVGEKEADLGVVAVRDLVAGDQEEVAREEVVEAVRRRVT